MRLTSTLLVTLAVSSAILHAQTSTLPAAPSQIQGRQIIDRALAALGGPEFSNLRTVETFGRVYGFFHDQLSGLDIARTYREFGAEKPAKGLGVTERQIFGKKQDYSVLFLPDQAFDITFRGARPIPDENWQRYYRSTENDILYILRFRLKEPGLQFDFVRSDVLLSAHVEIVEVSDANDRVITVYFDHNTMLPLRQVFKWQDPATHERNEDITIYNKWRDAGFGVKWPFSIERQRNGYKIYQSFADSVEVNKALPKNILDLPPGAKLLKKVD